MIRAPRRDEPLALHQQECFSHFGYRGGDFPEMEKAARETIALPIFFELTRGQLRYVAGTIEKFYAE